MDQSGIKKEKIECKQEILRINPELLCVKTETDKKVLYEELQKIKKSEFDNNSCISFQDLEGKPFTKKDVKEDENHDKNDEDTVEEKSWTKSEKEETLKEPLSFEKSEFDEKDSKISSFQDLEGKKHNEEVLEDDEDNLEDDEEEEEEDSDTESEFGGESKQLYFCSICWKDFRYRLHLKRHKRRWHQKDKPPKFKCEPCQQEFYKGTKFTEHFKKCRFRHLQKKIYECSVCKKAFPYFNSWKDHERTAHCSSAKSFVCHVCGKAFRLQKTLNHHISMHKEFWNNCKICERPFRKLRDLHKHLKTHDNKVPYVCGKCNVGFTEKRDFKKHNKTVHANRHAYANWENYQY